MAETPDGQEKTEQPSGKRLDKARGEGNVARSQEINLVIGLMTALLYFALNGKAMVESVMRMVQEIFANTLRLEITQISAHHLLQTTLKDMAAILLPFMLVLVVVAVITNIAQFGLNFTSKPLAPSLNKINMLSGIKRLFGAARLIEVAKSVVKLLVIGCIPYLIIKNEADTLPLIMDMHVWLIMAYIGKIIIKILCNVGLALLLIAVLDLIYQKRKYIKDLMMTKEEVKDEYKQSEGDPLVRSKIRSKQMDFVRKLMMDQIPKADVVITNPVHLAVALKYDRQTMDAPKVVGKGARLIAEKIKQIAREHNVPIIENKPLAQSLYKTVEIGEYIPETLFKAVAEVLAYVYRQKKKMHAA